MDDIWENISTATVIIPSAHVCVLIKIYWNVTVNKNGKDLILCHKINRGSEAEQGVS